METDSFITHNLLLWVMKQADFKAPLNKKCNVMRCDAGKNEIKQKSKISNIL